MERFILALVLSALLGGCALKPQDALTRMMDSISWQTSGACVMGEYSVPCLSAGFAGDKDAQYFFLIGKSGDGIVAILRKDKNGQTVIWKQKE